MDDHDVLREAASLWDGFLISGMHLSENGKTGKRKESQSLGEEEWEVYSFQRSRRLQKTSEGRGGSRKEIRIESY